MSEGRIERFEDLIAWQKARELAKVIYRRTGEGAFSKDFGLTNQIRKAVVSIPSNITEGFERGTPSEFHHFLSIAKSSCAEVRTQLYIGHDVGYLDAHELRALLAQAEEVGRIVGGLRISTKRKRRS